MHFCAAFDTNFNVLTATNPARPSSWHLFRVRNTGFFRAISCASAALCVIVGNYQLSGGVYYSTHPARGRAAWTGEQANVEGDSFLPDRAAVRPASARCTRRPPRPGQGSRGPRWPSATAETRFRWRPA